VITPSMATLRTCPGACTRKSAPRSAQAGAKWDRRFRSESAWGQRVARVAVEQHDVVRLGPRAAQLQSKTHPFHLARVLPPDQAVAGSAPPGAPLRSNTLRCDCARRTPVRAPTSARSRGKDLARAGQGPLDPLGRGTGHRVERNASTPSWANHTRQRHTESSPAPNALPISTAVQPASISSTARAQSAFPRTVDPAKTRNAATCSALATN